VLLLLVLLDDAARAAALVDAEPLLPARAAAPAAAAAARPAAGAARPGPGLRLDQVVQRHVELLVRHGAGWGRGQR
jgi:hypothetical protein